MLLLLRARSSWMKVAVPALIVLAALAGVASAKGNDEDDDSAELYKLKPCEATMTAGKCRCSVRQLHPTQIAVGMIEVQAKVDKLKERDKDDELYDYLEKKKHREPVTIGPDEVLYITDHHHLAVALLNMGVDETYCQVVDNRSSQRIDDFWKGMADDHKAWLKDEKGQPRSAAEIPASVDGLRDDPYRSLAGEVRDKCGFKKTSGEFAEFKWADYFRETNAPGENRPIPAQLIQTNMKAAVKQAMELAKLPAAKALDLPGYMAKPCKKD